MKSNLGKHISAFIGLSAYALLFLASAGPKYVSRITSTQVGYEQVSKKTTSFPYEVSYELPVLQAVEQTKQDQVKGGVMVSCEVSSFEAVKGYDEQKAIFTADPKKPGYDVYEVSRKIKYDVQPDAIWFNIRIKNNQDRILKLKDVAIVLLIDGVAFNIPEDARQEWVGGMLVKGFEKTQRIRGPKISGLATDKIIYISINDVPTEYSQAGEVVKKENFEWYYQVKRESITKQETMEYSYEETPVYKETCSKCGGTGQITQTDKCSKCGGNGKLQYYSNGQSYIDKCNVCGGGGYQSYKSKCGDCNGGGKIAYPKSPLPKENSRIEWSGWVVKIETRPGNVAISAINPRTGSYVYAGATDQYVNGWDSRSISWYSSNTSTTSSYPIILECRGTKYKVLPYDAKGNPSPVVTINFNNGPKITGGKFVN